MKHHKLGGAGAGRLKTTEMHSFTIPEAGSLKSGCQKSHVCSPSFWCLPTALRVPSLAGAQHSLGLCRQWLLPLYVCLYLHVAFPSVCVSPCISSHLLPSEYFSLCNSLPLSIRTLVLLVLGLILFQPDPS